MASDAILVDLSVPAPSTVGAMGPLNLVPKKKGRSSFYALPKTLSEEDDPFGLLCFQSKREIMDKDKLNGKKSEGRRVLRKEASTGMLVQIDADFDSSKDYISESLYSITSLSGTSHLLGMS